jgi:two-component system response regulator LytT
MGRKPRRNNEFVDVSGDEVILIERAGHFFPVARSQVQWAHAKGDYVRLHIPGESYLVRKSLEYLANRWTEHGFVRIHRAYLVHFPLVTDLSRGPSGYKVSLGSGPDAIDIPVSRKHEQEVKQRWIQKGHHHDGDGASHTT